MNKLMKEPDWTLALVGVANRWWRGLGRQRHHPTLQRQTGAQMATAGRHSLTASAAPTHSPF